MKKLLLPLIALVLVLAACGQSKDADKKEDTKSYTMDDGKKVDIPKIQNVLPLLHLHMLEDLRS